MPITARDPDAKRRRGYTDRKTYVRVDGSEVLFRKDWKRRVAELAERSGGRCEEIMQVNHADGGGFERCHSAAVDPHHKVKRSKRRDDRIENLEHLCRYHHDRKDNRKVRWSAGRSQHAGGTR